MAEAGLGRNMSEQAKRKPHAMWGCTSLLRKGVGYLVLFCSECSEHRRCEGTEEPTE